MAKRTRYPRDPQKYPDEDKYPEIMSKMDPLIIRVSPTVLLVGSTTYTAKIKLGYRFNGFHVNVTGVGIPIYTEEVDIENASTTNKSTINGMSDAYNVVEARATEWMDDLEKSMIDDSKEKNIVDLLREIKYQMHFDLSGHKYPAIIPPGQPGYDETMYDDRMEVCPEVPTYITDIYKLLAEMNARLNNLMVVMASDGTGSDIPTDPNYGKNRLINDVTATYDDNTHGFNITYDYGERVTAGLNERIGDINNTNANSVIGKLDTISTNVNTVATSVNTVATNVDNVATKIEAVHRAIGTGSDDNSVQKRLDAIATDIVSLNGQSAVNATTISNAITEGLNQLVGQINTLNSKPIMSLDSTCISRMNTWYNDIYNSDADNMIITMKKFFGKTGITDSTNIGEKLDRVIYWWGDQDAETPVDYAFFIRSKVDTVITKGYVGHGYETSDAPNRGFYNSVQNKYGVYVSI
jgi:outer membrane murein-binding lipoprotein Lpp